MMIGLPDSDETSETETARAICDMGAMGARIYPTVVFRGTALADMAARGEYTPLVAETAVERTAAALSVFIARGIPVIRVGLQSGEMEGAVVSGGYHPAIGELAYGRYFRDAMEHGLAGKEAAGRHVTVMTAPADLSKAIGQHGMNRIYLTEKFSLGGMKFMASAEIFAPFLSDADIGRLTFIRALLYFWRMHFWRLAQERHGYRNAFENA